jgi:tryptophanyl-tRNA synthetase
MSKSEGNVILLSAEPEAIREAVHRMYTDPNHLRASDPGTVEGNVVFTYLDAFDESEAEVVELKACCYRRGGLGDMAVKRRLEAILQRLLAPIRGRRGLCSQTGIRARGPARGNKESTAITQSTLAELRSGLGLFRLD